MEIEPIMNYQWVYILGYTAFGLFPSLGLSGSGYKVLWWYAYTRPVHKRELRTLSICVNLQGSRKSWYHWVAYFYLDLGLYIKGF